jgi:hypothetical protein
METLVKSYWSSRVGSQPSIPGLRSVLNDDQYVGMNGKLPLARQLCLRLRVDVARTE